MTELTLETAQKIATATLKTAREKSFKPLAVVVYDARGALKALLSEDGQYWRCTRSTGARRCFFAPRGGT